MLNVRNVAGRTGNNLYFCRENLALAMKKYIFIILISLVGLIPALAAPQLPDSEPEWKNVAVDGRKTAVFCIYTDSRGLVWIGSNHGLDFYDGVSTVAVGSEQLSGSQIYAIVEHQGKLYLGTNNGLLTYEFSTGRIEELPQVALREIRALMLVDNALWIGSLNGLSILDTNTGLIDDKTAGLPHRSVYSLLRDSRGIIYAGTYLGPARFDASSGAFYPLQVRIGGQLQAASLANCMLESDAHDCIYVGCEGVLLRYVPSADRWERISAFDSNNIKCLAHGVDGHIMTGTDNGVFDYQPGFAPRHFRHDSRRETSLGDNEVWCIHVDRANNIWAGHERGFSVASNSSTTRGVKLGTLTNSGEGNEIYSIFRDSRGDLWFAGTNGAIRLSDGNSVDWFRHSELPGALSHKRIRGVFEDSDGDIYFATDGGINRFNRGKNNFDVFHVTDSAGRHNSNWVYALGSIGDSIWTGGFLSGLHFVHRDKFVHGGGNIVSDYALNEANPDSKGATLANDMVNNVVADREGNLWILLFRDKALNRYNPRENRLEKIDIHAITGSYPGNVALDKSGRVWCAFGGGVVVFDGGDISSPQLVRFPHGASDAAAVMAMGAVGDGMWIATQRNIWEVAGNPLKATMLPVPQKTYTAIYEDPEGRGVILGSIDEVIAVNRDGSEITQKSHAIKMALAEKDDASLDLSDISMATHGLKIPYGGSLSLRVSTLDYSPESVQRYMYRLAGSSRDTSATWTVLPEGMNNITLNALKMGNYELHIKAVGAPDTPIVIPLNVQSPAWLSLWAIVLYIIGGVVIIATLVAYLRRRNSRTFAERERRTMLENTEKKLAFLSTISHDLKTPLSMIIGPVSLMKERAADPESRRTLQTVYDNAVRLNNMIHRTLELQRLEDADDSLMILSTFDAVEFCRSVFDVFRENNPQKKFVFHSSCRKLVIEADAVKFESVITNLLSNACKYSGDGSTISCGISCNGDKVEIVVADDGVGIADIDQPLVFQRMFRAPSTAGTNEGTGLGLYLIRRYLELMGGNIELYSKEGQGTSFVVTLPVSDKDESKESEPQTEADDNGKPKILIVEDNMQISGFIMDLLKSDYTCIHAENGRAGISLAASFNPDLIIADEMMPIMGGLEMVRHLKQNPRLSAVPVIMLTAKDDTATENESIKLGVDVFMAKPFEPSALIARIGHLLKTRAEIKEMVRVQAITEAEEKPIEAESVNEKSLARISKIIEDNISDPDLNVNFLCEKSGIPNKQLYRLVKKYMGMAPLDYIRSVRLRKAAMLLSQHRFTVSEISYMVGFNTPSYFAKCFQAQFGVKPSQYQSDDEAGGKI